jgi:trimethylamine corrinoid protein
MLDILESKRVGWPKRLRQGQVLFLQGDPVSWIYLVKHGRVKTHVLSKDGKARAFGIYGRDDALGLTAFVLGRDHLFSASAWEEAEVWVVSPEDLAALLQSDPAFARAVIHYLATYVEAFQNEVEALSFLDTQDRLKRSLEALAATHGHETREGIQLDLTITHEEIAELTAADRSTVTMLLNELKRQGYLWKVGRKIVILPQAHMRILENLVAAVCRADESRARHWAAQAVDEQIDPVKIFETLTRCMQSVEQSQRRGELLAPDLVGMAVALKEAISVLESGSGQGPDSLRSLATVVIGTIEGDIHDVGKRLVGARLTLAGFRVVDLGVDVPMARFVEAVRQHQADFLAISCIVKLGQARLADIKAALGKADLGQVRVFIGGGGVTQEQAAELGATALSDPSSLIELLSGPTLAPNFPDLL